MSEPIEIESPAQTYDGRYLPPASEFGSKYLVPVASDWEIKATVDAALYGGAAIEVVTLYRARYTSVGNPDNVRTYYLWTTPDGKACPIENTCDECHGRGRMSDPLDREDFVCPYCDGLGWFFGLTRQKTARSSCARRRNLKGR